jgi:hypothetical protein
VDLMLLPPVFECIVETERTFRRKPRHVKEERRRGNRESFTPDVTFRWRTEAGEPQSRGPAIQRSR